MAEQTTRDPMQALWDAHPLPWVADDSRPDHEGEVIVWDANGQQVLYCGDMEDCTAADIKLADLLASAPGLLAVCAALLRWYHDPHALAITDVVALAEDAIAKARPAPDPRPPIPDPR